MARDTLRRGSQRVQRTQRFPSSPIGDFYHAAFRRVSSSALSAASASLVVAGLLTVLSVPVGAQQLAGPASLTTNSDSRELVNGKDWHLVGNVEIEMRDAKLYADEVWYYSDDHRAVAAGNVTYTQGRNTISGDRGEMNTETKLGTFYNAWGNAALQPQRQSAPVGGFVAPPMTGQDTDVYFYGDRIEKIGPKKYKITNGGFTTCVQPSPRWEFHAGTVVLNIDHYTLLRNAVLNVKNVPMFYLPVLYYPTKEEGRATGFLLPTYGSSELRGQTISNAFFWAIDRSQDATLMHDWFSKAGQGYGGEYRYASIGGDGTLRALVLDERLSGAESGLRSFDLRGGVNQILPYNLRARANVDYYSSVRTMQTFSTNLSDASRNSRFYGGNLVGAWRNYALSATFDRREYLTGATSSLITGSAPRVTFNRNERPIFRNSPVYFSVGSEFAQFDRQSRSGDVVDDTGLGRFDVNPQLRFPFKRWQWFTVNSLVSWRDTYYTRSQITDKEVSDEDLNRRYFTVQAQTVGPVFNRVWNTPDNGYAERFKHTIEPSLTIQRTSPIDNYKQILKTDGVDHVVGNTTSYAYALNNRLFAKRRIGPTSQSAEIVNVEIRQTYYTDENAAQGDIQYTTYKTATPSKFSPVMLAARVTPSPNVNATLRTEVDARYHEFRTISASGSYDWSQRVQTSVGWSREFFIEQLPEFSDPALLDHALNIDTRTRTLDNRLGANYSINLDLLRSTIVQQRITAFYNAQCCGIAFEYNIRNFPTGYLFPSDNRFFMSFTLAGIGNFSPFNGALGTVPR
jgi:LPS-assembly protein